MALSTKSLSFRNVIYNTSSTLPSSFNNIGVHKQHCKKHHSATLLKRISRSQVQRLQKKTVPSSTTESPIPFEALIDDNLIGS